MAMDGSSGQRAAGEWRLTSLGWVWVEATPVCVGLAGVDRGWERDTRALLERGRMAREDAADDAPTLRGVR